MPQKPTFQFHNTTTACDVCEFHSSLLGLTLRDLLRLKMNACLFLRSYAKLRPEDPGFGVRDVVGEASCAAQARYGQLVPQTDFYMLLPIADRTFPSSHLLQIRLHTRGHHASRTRRA